MTDEMIQQIPQQSGSYATSGLIGGAVVGGVAGAAGAHYKNWGITQKPDLDKVFAQAPDYFEAQGKKGNSAKWADAGEIVKGVQNLESQYDEKIAELQKTGGITDADLPKNLVDKRNNAQDALDKVLEQEKAKYSTSGNAIDSKKFPKFKDINTADLPTINVKNGKAFKANQIESIYNNLTNEVINAESALETKLNGGLRKNKTTIKNFIERSNNDAIRDLASKSESEIADYFAEKEVGNFWTGGKKPSTQYKRGMVIAEAYYPMPTTLADEEFAQIGQDLKPGDKVPSGCSTKTIKYKAENGRELYKTIYFDDKQAQEMLNSKKAQVEELRKVAADEIFAETQKAVTINKDIYNLASAIEKSVPVEKAKATGLYTPATSGVADTLNIAQILKEGKGISTYTKGKGVYTGYAADILKLEESLANAKKAGTAATMPSTLNSTFATGISVEDALAQVRERNAIYKNYSRQLKGLEKQLEESVGNNAIVKDLNEKIATEIASNERLVKAKAALAEQFPQLFSETQGLTEEEIANKVKESSVVKNAETKLQAAKDEIAKYVEEKGLKGEISTEEAIKKFGKTKEEFVKTAKDEAKTKLETLLKDLKVGNKWATAALAGGILALAGLGIGSSMKKDA